MVDFINYIGSRMIVVDKTRRDRSLMVRNQLRGMFQKCENDSNYAFSSAKPSYKMPSGNTVPIEYHKWEADEDVSKKLSFLSRLKRKPFSMVKHFMWMKRNR